MKVMVIGGTETMGAGVVRARGAKKPEVMGASRRGDSDLTHPVFR